MFASRQRGTLIAKGLKIVGSVTAEGLVEVNGQIDGELHCTSLVIARGAHVNGTVAAERVVVDGTVEGPIHGGDVILKSQAHVVGDIHHQSLAIESGAFFDGRSVQIRRNGQATEKLEAKSLKQIANPRESLSPDRAGQVCGGGLAGPSAGVWLLRAYPYYAPYGYYRPASAVRYLLTSSSRCARPLADRKQTFLRPAGIFSGEADNAGCGDQPPRIDFAAGPH